MRDSLNEARRELASLEEEHAEELARFDDEYIQISQQMLDRWQIWCAKTTPNKKLSGRDAPPRQIRDVLSVGRSRDEQRGLTLNPRADRREVVVTNSEVTLPVRGL